MTIIDLRFSEDLRSLFIIFNDNAQLKTVKTIAGQAGLLNEVTINRESKECLTLTTEQSLLISSQFKEFIALLKTPWLKLSQLINLKREHELLKKSARALGFFEFYSQENESDRQYKIYDGDNSPMHSLKTIGNPTILIEDVDYNCTIL